LIELAELKSLFEEGCLESIVKKVSAWLDGVDLASCSPTGIKAMGLS
jgi:hypothetical protein